MVTVASPGVVAPMSDQAPGSLGNQLFARLFPFLVSAPLLAGAWLASADHVRILSSPFPLWIILALNGVIAAVAGAIALFSTGDGPIDDAPEMIRVPRSEWESLQRRQALAQCVTESRRPDSPSLYALYHLSHDLPWVGLRGPPRSGDRLSAL
jgi:hypothetical protein